MNRESFKNKILTKLGHPVIDQEVDDSQVNLAIDEAIDYYLEYSGIGASFTNYLLYTVDSRIDKLIMPPEVKIIESVESYVDANEFINMLRKNAVFLSLSNNQFTGYDLVTFYLYSEYIEMFDNLVSRKYLFDYIEMTKELILTPRPAMGTTLVLTYSGRVDKSSNAFYDNIWITKYATALLKEMWGDILTKYNNYNISGTININGEKILNNAREDRFRLEEELRTTFQPPPSFFIG